MVRRLGSSNVHRSQSPRFPDDFPSEIYSPPDPLPAPLALYSTSSSEDIWR